MSEKLNFLDQFLKEEFEKNPDFLKGLNEWSRPRDILSNPVECTTGYECHMPSRYSLIADGAQYKCKDCGRTFEFVIPINNSDGTWNRSGWYLLSPSIFDIIKSWFKF